DGLAQEPILGEPHFPGGAAPELSFQQVAAGDELTRFPRRHVVGGGPPFVGAREARSPLVGHAALALPRKEARSDPTSTPTPSRSRMLPTNSSIGSRISRRFEIIAASVVTSMAMAGMPVGHAGRPRKRRYRVASTSVSAARSWLVVPNSCHNARPAGRSTTASPTWTSTS